MIEVENVEGLTLVRLKEKVFNSSKAPQMKTEFLKLISEGAQNILVNLENVETIDSSGLGSFNFGKRQLNNLGGDLKLCCLQSKAVNLLKISKLDRVYKIYDSEEEGIRKFFSED